jgi:Asp-tRNA(Asn)/Glu-tRNA(Gln) amidotransferase A subunit family amidase
MTAVAQVQEALEGARTSQGALNAFTHIDDDRALAAAERIDGDVAAGKDPGPLAGVPIGIKDLIDHRGRTTTAGSAFLRIEATTSAPVIERLEQAGAVIIGRTGLHEFAFGFSSENPHFGPVRNPWDTNTSPGGSSGGSAAAVGAGITPLSIGTDTGGSVRVPAALCGCFGLKVTHGRVPTDGVFPLAGSLDTVGPLAASMSLIETSYRVMSGDETPIPAAGPLRLGIPQPWYDEAPMDPRVATTFESAVANLLSMGHQVETVAMPDVLPSFELINAIASEVNAVHAGFRAQELPYGDDVAKRLDECAQVTEAAMASGRRWQGMIRDRFADALRSVDFLITPSTASMRKVIGDDTIGDRHYRTVISWFSALVNHSTGPALVMPLIGTGRPPDSFQMIGPPGSETALIGIGTNLEESGFVGFVPAMDWIE